MNLAGLEIYDKLPQTDCGKCEAPSCLSFVIQLVQGKKELNNCTELSSELKEEIEGSIPLALVQY